MGRERGNKTFNANMYFTMHNEEIFSSTLYTRVKVKVT